MPETPPDFDTLPDDAASLDGDDISRLVAALRHDDPDRRAEAAWSLADVAGDRPDRVPLKSGLVSALDDDHVWVRRGVMWAVTEIVEDAPERGRPVLDEVADRLGDDDPLVRGNVAISLMSVGAEHPVAVRSVVSDLVEHIADDDPFVSQYAKNAFRRLVAALRDFDGDPVTIRVTEAYADAVPTDGGVVTVADDLDGPAEIVVGDGQANATPAADDDSADDSAAASAASASRPEFGPPTSVPETPDIDASFRDFEPRRSLGRGQLTTKQQARAPAPTTSEDEHVVVLLRALRDDRRSGDLPADLVGAFRSWSNCDDHDHVLSVYGHGTHPRAWAATELTDSGSLLGRVGSATLDEALWYALGVTRAVGYAHARGIVHGGLWPGVVFLSNTLERRTWPVPKVSDFAIGPVLHDHSPRPPVPPGFAAPEHVAPDVYGRPDHATDCYQVGAVLYALVTGRSPFPQDPHVAVRKVRADQPLPVSEFDPSLPDAVTRFLSRTLAKDKTARYETIDDLRHDLELLVADHASFDA